MQSVYQLSNCNSRAPPDNGLCLQPWLIVLYKESQLSFSKRRRPIILVIEMNRSFCVDKKFFLQLKKNKKQTNVKKSPLLGRPAGPIVCVLIAESLMQYREIALSALHLEKVIQR